MNERPANWFLIRVALAVLVVVVPSGCRPEGDKSATNSTGEKPMAIEVTSTAFKDGQQIPARYTGEGEDVSPPLSWTGVPDGTKELVLICDDPDAPTAEPWVHWVIYKIPANVPGLPEGIPKKPRLKTPAGSLQGKNSWQAGQTIGYRGPMPPRGGGTHHYNFNLYALEAKMVSHPSLDKQTVLQEIADHILAEGQLTGTYAR